MKLQAHTLLNNLATLRMAKVGSNLRLNLDFQTMNLLKLLSIHYNALLLLDVAILSMNSSVSTSSQTELASQAYWLLLTPILTFIDTIGIVNTLHIILSKTRKRGPSLHILRLA